MKSQTEGAIDALLVIQGILGQLGFTLTSDNKYYKDYASTDGDAIRIIPVFDHGISVDIHRKLTGFNVIKSKVIPIVEGLSAPLDQIPVECLDDVSKIINTLAPFSKPPLAETFMITQNCSMCGDEVESFLYINGTYTCTKCAGYHK
jgi:hypothetical protein